MGRAKKDSAKTAAPRADDYRHSTIEQILRPDVGTQAQFRKKKAPAQYKYDSSLSPSLEWDEGNPAREEGESYLQTILDASSLGEAKSAASRLKAMSEPFLNWTGKAEHTSFEIPTLPLFVHERLSTRSIIATLESHRKKTAADEATLFDSLFADPHHSITDQILKAYEYKDKWVNRMILGDSLVVMNSLLQYEGMGGQVQMIYMDPPYGVKFGSNFQPFIRKRDVKHNDDEDMTREPEMVKAYRDTWELGLHSYLTYMRDRLLLARDLLSPSGSVFVQISDENLHHVRELMDEIFGASGFIAVIPFVKTTSATATTLSTVTDYLLWYAKDKSCLKYRQLYINRSSATLDEQYCCVLDNQGEIRRLTPEVAALEEYAHKRFMPGDLSSQSGSESNRQPFEFRGRSYLPPAHAYWKTNQDGLARLVEQNRICVIGDRLRYVRYAMDFPYVPINSLWTDTVISGFNAEKLYAVQTLAKVIDRCVLMTTDPGDLVLDPTCGSGTTAYVAEERGRRWITCDVSRVPLALARQRLLTATFPYFQLKDESMGPVGGFVYARHQNNKGAETGGIVPHITLKSITNDEPPDQEILVDRPEVTGACVRVTGPFAVEATIPTPTDVTDGDTEDSATATSGNFAARMLEVLRHAPVLALAGGKSIVLENLRIPAATLSLSAEATLEGSRDDSVAIVFGPENGSVSEKQVYEAAREAAAKRYTYLFVMGFACEPNARVLIEQCEKVCGISATYIAMTPDIMMGDLLKNMRSSQIFSVCGLPDVAVTQLGTPSHGKQPLFQVKLNGLDVYDPTSDTEPVVHRRGDDVPAWFLDTDYNALCFHVCQAFFPRTSAWDNLRRALKATYDESVWEHLAGDTSSPFAAGSQRKIAVKVIDDRGNELISVSDLPQELLS